MVKRYISKSDAHFIRECLEWNKMGYTERAMQYLRDDSLTNYREEVYLPTIKRMDECIGWMGEIIREKRDDQKKESGLQPG